MCVCVKPKNESKKKPGRVHDNNNNKWGNMDGRKGRRGMNEEEEYLMTRRCGIVVGGDGHNNNKCPCVVVMGELEKMGGSSL